MAAIARKAEVVRLLLDKGAHANAKNNLGVTALMGAAMYGRTEVVRLLLEKGADLNAKDIFGHTALFWANANNGQTGVAQMLKEAERKQTSGGTEQIAKVRGTVPDRFAGVPWGASKEEVEKAMASKNYPKDADSKPDIYVYNGEFAGYQAYLVFHFINNKVYEGSALFLWRENNDRLLDQRFLDLEAQLINKYGNPLFTYRAQGGEDWNPWEDRWKPGNFAIKLIKNYNFTPAPRDQLPTTIGKVDLTYQNILIREQEKKKAANRDL